MFSKFTKTFNFKSNFSPITASAVISVLTLTAANAATTPNFDMVGFATLEGGTTGGNGGKVVEVSNFEEFKQYAEDLETPYVIIVKGEINTGIKTHIDGNGHVATSGTETTYGELVQVGNNKTIVGKGDKAFFNRVGLAIQNKHNIIIRNIKFTMSDVPISKTDENKVVAFRNGAEVVLNDPDCIAISADSAVTNWEGKSKQASHNIWIDHCEFYNAPTSNKDRYDGLLDAKNNIYNATFSWNFFHDHHKGSLVGNSNGDSLRHEITFHHNYYKNLDARTPMMRYNNSHLYNNFVEGEGSGNGPNVRQGSDVYFENNHYAGLSKAIFAGDNGVATIVGNYYEGCANFKDSGCNSKKMKISVNPGTSLSSKDTAWVTYDEEIAKGKFDPKKFYSYTADPVSEVKTLVTTYAGIGKIDISEYENGTKIEPTLSSSSSATEPESSSAAESGSSATVESSSSAAEGDSQGVISSTLEYSIPSNAEIQIFSMTGKLLRKGTYAEREQLKASLPHGNYLMRIKSKTTRFNIR
ncbi:MAG: hypothetical protein MJY82_02835 [Fibrobacter sp.]|nr:hypothetical protein [Fibrobacter sp.]